MLFEKSVFGVNESVYNTKGYQRSPYDSEEFFKTMVKDCETSNFLVVNGMNDVVCGTLDEGSALKVISIVGEYKDVSDYRVLPNIEGVYINEVLNRSFDFLLDFNEYEVTKFVWKRLYEVFEEGLVDRFYEKVANTYEEWMNEVIK